MMPGELAASRVCARCGRTIAPRGNGSPRFCPVCGEELAAGPGDYPYERRLRPNSDPAANASLMLALCSLIPFVGLPFSVAAVWLGWKARERISRSAGELGGRGVASAGMTLGLITGVLWFPWWLRAC